MATVEYKIAQCMKCGSENVSTDTRRDGLKASVTVHCLECDWDTCFDMVFNPPAATGMPLGVEGKYIDDAG